MKYKEEMKFVGHRDQLFRINKFSMQDGKAAGVQLIDVSNRSGMHFDVNISRGLDIPHLDYCGENIGFIAPCGIVHSSYFDDKGLGFLKSFTAGFLTTCGLKTVGTPTEYEGTSYGLHGNISNIPAENVSYKICEVDIPYLEIEGDLSDAIIFGDRITLHRNIRCNYKERKIFLHDTVINKGSKRARHMILYHCNIGFPLLDPSAELYIPSYKVTPRNEHSATGLPTWMNLEEPNSQYEEMCYYHNLRRDENNNTCVGVFNPELGFGVSIAFDTTTLDHFVQWKMMGTNDYVLGLEAGNSTIDGISDAISNGSMKYLEPDESVEYHLTFSLLDNKTEFETMKTTMSLGRI